VMFLTVSKRLEFSASRRLFLPNESSEENRGLFGEESAARYGAGRNYVVWFVFTGQVDATTGMLMNISEIKHRAGAVIDERYDHKFLNEDNPDFAETVPTAENIALQLLADVAPMFRDSGAELTAVYLEETSQRSATAYANGSHEANYDFRFSAARQTMSPHLTREENERLFGAAASPHGHGHDYRVRLTVRSDSPKTPILPNAVLTGCVDSLIDELDHRNLNAEVPGLTDLPKTTEVLARYIFRRAKKTLPLHRVRLHERGDFFAEYHASGQHLLGMQMPFSAVHRLQSYAHSPEQNVEMYGKCNNPRGHGHLYISEATIADQLDEKSGTLGNFADFQDALRIAVRDWDNKHLDLETDEFRKRPSTGENIVQALWGKLNPLLQNRLQRLRLWETANNRFTLRRAQSE
ncbi:MAG TPA: 6-carboxytetrahydropterin synthase, partial [Chthoniobacterales bacterium]|nr:6-carboxytetrahydropterin synthase [Chthoniobacterales bacterium]